MRNLASFERQAVGLLSAGKLTGDTFLTKIRARAKRSFFSLVKMAR